MYLGKKISSHICALDTTEPALHLGEGATAQAIQEVTGPLGLVSCRFTHVYPDGPAAYFTFQALSKKAAVLEHFCCYHAGRRHHHPSARRGARSSPVIRSGAPGAFRRHAASAQKRPRSQRASESGCADRPVMEHAPRDLNEAWS